VGDFRRSRFPAADEIAGQEKNLLSFRVSKSPPLAGESQGEGLFDHEITLTSVLSHRGSGVFGFAKVADVTSLHASKLVCGRLTATVSSRSL
jgi:hypothetical protein